MLHLIVVQIIVDRWWYYSPPERIDVATVTLIEKHMPNSKSPNQGSAASILQRCNKPLLESKEQKKTALKKAFESLPKKYP